MTFSAGSQLAAKDGAIDGAPDLVGVIEGVSDGATEGAPGTVNFPSKQSH